MLGDPSLMLFDFHGIQLCSYERVTTEIVVDRVRRLSRLTLKNLTLATPVSMSKNGGSHA